MKCMFVYIYNCFVKKEKPTPKPILKLDYLMPSLTLFTSPDQRVKPFKCSPKSVRINI